MPSPRNPFNTSSTDLNVTMSQTKRPSFQASLASAPAMTLSSLPGSSTSPDGPPPQPSLDNTDLEEPPPYTPRASVATGEATVEVGPNRPFQTVRPSTSPQNGLLQPHNQVAHHRIPSSSPPSLSLTPSERITQRLTNTLTNVVNRLNSPPSSHSNTNNYDPRAVNRPTGQTWTSYPGQNVTFPTPSNPTPRNAHLVPPPRHPSSAPVRQQSPPLSTSTSSQSLPSTSDHSSDFARDFYAAGTGSGEALVRESIFAPPTGPPPSEGQASTTTTHSAVLNDGRPTSEPKVGHPLLMDGKLLVYPKGYECRKCHNVGYKDANPQKPCKHCWKKYATPFAGALAYSFPANTASCSASNIQKPLPHVLPPASRLRQAAQSSPRPSAPFAPAGNMTNYHGGFYNPPPSLIPFNSPPAGGAVTYMAGDPRIGGILCRRCNGDGTISGIGILFFELETCPLCNGIGRLFQ